ncbi:MAG TPA: S1/P1 nuclease [Ignavibacteriaceae bacterium]|nr:S1/P1 nuclease [Ignavibacteriaceae bacterium]
MNKKLLLFLFLVFLPVSVILSWGEEGHKLISKNAMTLLPDEMSSFIKWQDYITLHSTDPDNRRDIDKTEAPRHFIDIDFYPEFLNGKMIKNKQELVNEYGDTTVTKMGLLPWATVDSYNNLVNALKEKNRDKALLYAADLGHYVADGHQPLHTIMNYNGQLTDQKGIHFRYESVIIDTNLATIEKDFHSEKAEYISNPLNFIFDYISDANSAAELLLAADSFAFKYSKSRNGTDYYRLLWFRTKYITENLIENSARDFASLFYSAWVDAGKPSFDEIN